jgi:hypothetical protein
MSASRRREFAECERFPRAWRLSLSMLEDSPDTTRERQRCLRLMFHALATSSLEEVTRVLAAAGVVSAPVKGIVLSRWLYDDVVNRPFVDVDLLVSRSGFARATDVVTTRGWAVSDRTDEMGELLFSVNGVAVELHAEVGRPDLVRTTVDEVLSRAVRDRQTFNFEILRIDDIDHFLLLVANVVKDGFTYANSHQPDDLERMLQKLQPRVAELIERTGTAGFMTALHNVALWMTEKHGSTDFRALTLQLPSRGRRAFRAAVRTQWRLSSRKTSRLSHAGGVLGLALATLTPDSPALRLRGLARVVRRGLRRRLGQDPG